MENSLTAIERLIQKLEIYVTTTFELFKYQAIDKTAGVFSYVALRIVIAAVVGFALLFLNIGFAIWIGESLQSNYLGFMIIAGGYLLLTILLYIFRESIIKTPVSNFLIQKLKNEDIL